MQTCSCQPAGNAARRSPCNAAVAALTACDVQHLQAALVPAAALNEQAGSTVISVHDVRNEARHALILGTLPACPQGSIKTSSLLSGVEQSQGGQVAAVMAVPSIGITVT